MKHLKSVTHFFLTSASSMKYFRLLNQTLFDQLRTNVYKDWLSKRFIKNFSDLVYWIQVLQVNFTSIDHITHVIKTHIHVLFSRVNRPFWRNRLINFAVIEDWYRTFKNFSIYALKFFNFCSKSTNPAYFFSCCSELNVFSLCHVKCDNSLSYALPLYRRSFMLYYWPCSWTIHIFTPCSVYISKCWQTYWWRFRRVLYTKFNGGGDVSHNSLYHLSLSLCLWVHNARE